MRRLLGTLLAATPHWTFQTVEWSRKVASVHAELLRSPPTHFVLPNLPGILTNDVQDQFYQATNASNRIVTLVSSQYTTPASLERWMQVHSQDADIFLVVGGNDKNKNCNDDKNRNAMSSTEVIQFLTQRQSSRSSRSTHIWAVANPNDKSSIDNVHRKVEAGASGIITQPPLVSHAMDVLNSYPRDKECAYVVGLAMPTSVNSLYFWLHRLLRQPELQNDALFCDHVHYFASCSSSQQQQQLQQLQRDNDYSSINWCRQQLSSLAQDAKHVHGIHYMPMTNTEDLLLLLRRDDDGANT